MNQQNDEENIVQFYGSTPPAHQSTMTSPSRAIDVTVEARFSSCWHLRSNRDCGKDPATNNNTNFEV